jgi:hypothetical protein
MAIAVNHAAAQQRPRDFDILGIRMGMSPADVAAKLREADPGATVRTGKMAQLKTTGGTVFAEYVPRIRFNNAKSLHNGNGFFMPRTGDNTLVQFQRVVYHSDGAGVLPDAYIRSLVEKYGPPQHREGDDSPTFYWLFTEDGKPIRLPSKIEPLTKESSTRGSCGILLHAKADEHNVDSAGWWEYDNRQKLKYAQECPAAIALYVRLNERSGVVSHASFTLTDVKRFADADRSVTSAEKAAQDADAARDRERAKGAKPKL